MKLITILIFILLLSRSESQTISDSTSEDQPCDTTFILKFNPKIGDLRTNLRVMDNGAHDYSSTIYIQFYRINNDSLFQTLACYVPPSMLLNWKFEDVNFDGYSDLVITHDMGGTFADVCYIIYLFDVKSSRFYHSEEFSTFCGSLSFSPDEKHITSEYRANCAECSTKETYLVKRNHLILIEKSTEDKNWDTGEIFTKVEKLIKGKMVVVKEH
jgi:hypothetical protein